MKPKVIEADWPLGNDECEVYNRSQCDESISDGDVLIILDPPMIAILVQAWPTRAVGTQGKEIHELADGETWETFEDGRYIPSFLLAAQTAQARGI